MPEAASGAMGMKIFSEYIAVGCLSVKYLAMECLSVSCHGMPEC